MTQKGALFFIEDIMFDQQKLIGQNRRMLRLDTRTGQPIENEVAAPPTQQSLAREQRLATKFGANWEKRIGPCGIYNCAGLVWASRRTAIYEDAEWDKIYQDDDYRELKGSELPMPGDLAIYSQSDVGYLHVGQVLSLEPVLLSAGGLIPKILSKWDDASGEYIHHPMDVHFRDRFTDFQLKYWTDRTP